MSTIEKRGDTYRIRASAGYNTKDKQIRPSITWRPAPGMTQRQIERELARQKVLFDERIKSGQFLDGSIRLKAFADQWFADYGKEHLKATTYKNYMDCMKRIDAALGHIRLDRLQPHQIIEFYDNLQEAGAREDIKYTASADIGAIIKSQGLKLCEVSERAGIAAGTLRACIRKQYTTRKTAEAISLALGKPLRELFTTNQDSATLSGATVLYHHRVLSTILTTAVHWQILQSNPCSRIKPPKAEHKEAKYLDELQAAELIMHLEQEPLQFRAIITLLLYSGMRRGEMCGLEWSDIDFANGLVDINKASLYLADRGIFEDDTKNVSSRRVIKLPALVFDLLTQHRADQAKRRLLLVERWVDSQKVFTQWDGKPIHPDTVTSWFHDFVKRNGLPAITLHSLRHTNATLLIASGTDIKTVSKRLGHSNTATTGNIYTHAIKTADEMAAESLQDMLAPAKPKKA